MAKTYYIRLIIISLVAIAAVISGYKFVFLEFPLWASTEQAVWKIEAKISFIGLDKPASVKANLPEPPPQRKLSALDQASVGYTFEMIESEGTRYGHWQTDKASGKQTLYLRGIVHYSDDPVVSSPPNGERELRFTPMEETTAKDYVNSLTSSALDLSVLEIIAGVNSGAVGAVLLEKSDSNQARAKLIADLISLSGIPARFSRGVQLTEQRSSQGIKAFIEVFDSQQRRWRVFDPHEELELEGRNVVLLQQEGEYLFEVYGGVNSEISFTTLREQWPAYQAAYASASYADNYLMDLSLFSLPVNQQKTFKTLLLIPLGALVVVILRNLVGIRTSGTFMPILIAMVFLQTTLVTGLLLFLVVVALGLAVRSLLSHLNLLLVPRIASVLVVVIVIYAAIGIVGYKLGFDWAAKVTFFPMIILSWTIERMSILWEEEGPKEVLEQGGGSLLTAVLAFLLMGNAVVADTIFLYPELLLAVLAVILAIGSYTGYRLSDLKRFEPLERK